MDGNGAGKGLRSFIKEWMLVFAMLAGMASYFALSALELPPAFREDIDRAVGFIQPALIFAMLFLTFCKIDPRHLSLKTWHFWLLAIQGGLFAGIGCLLMAVPRSGMRIVLEGAMLCLVCPTATAGAVITGKLGGSVRHITSYTILINVLAAVLIPAVVPFVHPNPALGAMKASLLILGKVFPLLLFPLGCAWLLRIVSPRICARVAAVSDLSFYLWAVALALAIAVTTRSLVHSSIDLWTELGLVAVSLASCALQFWLGRKVGERYGDKVTAGQSLGQKNTVLAIWMGYTFFTPVTAVVGGFYSIWHNLFNSWQLYRHEHEKHRPNEN